MDAKVIYWAAAVVNFVALTAFAVAGVRQAGRGELARGSAREAALRFAWSRRGPELDRALERAAALSPTR